jgi:Fe-S cluster assembly protein SufD
VIQDHVALGAGPHPPRLTNAVTQVVVGDDASLELVVLQREDAAARALSNLSVRVERDGRFASHVVTLGGRFVRNDLAALLADENAECRLLGLFLGTGERLVDNHTLVDHAMPHGRSEELYKGILADRSRGVFRGRVVVRPGANKTDARQSNANLILGRGAEIDTKPQLEIHADDVKCSHGSAIGRIDPEALFYLRARGLSEAAARAVLTRGFAHEVLAALPHAALVEALGDALAARLHEAGVDG